VIVLFTDFGLDGPYIGQMKAVLAQMAPGIAVIDLFADAPVGNPKASAYLLAAYASWFPAGNVFLCVVDPGVGGTRPAIIIEAHGSWYVGPGNGLFELVQRRAGKAQGFDINWKPSASLAELPRTRSVRARRGHAGARGATARPTSQG
jgi:S-adenosyl-L-methionine hydrolase (adenosine-forming)